MTVTFLLIVITAVAVLWAFYLVVLDDNPPFEIYNNPLPTDKPAYVAGEIVRLRLSFCKYTDASYTLHKQFEDGLIWGVPLTTLPGTSAGVCDTIWTAGTIVPVTLPPGNYRISGTSVFHVNPLTDREVRWQSQFFEVVRDE